MSIHATGGVRAGKGGVGERGAHSRETEADSKASLIEKLKGLKCLPSSLTFALIAACK